MKCKGEEGFSGTTTYFWEHNAQRALDFAKQMQQRPHPSGQRIKTPAVVGAVIDLGLCLNLLDSTYIEMVRKSHDELVELLESVNEPLPINDGGPDRVDRKLDCAVITLLHLARSQEEKRPFDTVRAAFFEGKPLYDNAGFAASTHIQIAVRDPKCILGYFRPLDAKGKHRKFK